MALICGFKLGRASQHSLSISPGGDYSQVFEHPDRIVVSDFKEGGLVFGDQLWKSVPG